MSLNERNHDQDPELEFTDEDTFELYRLISKYREVYKVGGDQTLEETQGDMFGSTTSDRDRAKMSKVPGAIHTV